MIDQPVTEPWGLPALRGRLVELSARGASATLTTAIGIVLEAQTAAEPVGWITPAGASFYPPDAADSGVDRAALVVVRDGVGDRRGAYRGRAGCCRSGAFGLVVIDYSQGEQVALPSPVQGRLVTLAQAHDAAIVCLTAKPDDATSLGSLVSLRAAALRLHDPKAGHTVSIRVLKDKRRGPGFAQVLKVRGPPKGTENGSWNRESRTAGKRTTR